MKILEAAQEYLARKARKKHPVGWFDSHRRWYPSIIEHQNCCSDIRGPSAKYPYSYITHCRTAQHVANLYGVEERHLKEAVYVWTRYDAEIAKKILAVVIMSERSGEPLSTARIKTIARKVMENAEEDGENGHNYSQPQSCARGCRVSGVEGRTKCGFLGALH